MGHASSAMMDRYSHGIDGSVAEAGRRLQAYIDAQRSGHRRTPCGPARGQTHLPGAVLQRS